VVVGLSVMAKYLVILLLLSSCSTIEILDGLCYNDKEETHLCEEENSWDACEPWLNHDGETWSNCMMMYT
jgi:hypothetical protein